MTITKKTVADKLAAYLRHELTLGDLVKWAEHSMQEGFFEEKNAKLLAKVIGRIGVADVHAFRLSREDCGEILKQLGYAFLSKRIDVSVRTMGRAVGHLAGAVNTGKRVKTMAGYGR